MSPQSHHSDVKALARIAVCYIQIACSRTSADYLVTSPLPGWTDGLARKRLVGSLS